MNLREWIDKADSTFQEDVLSSVGGAFNVLAIGDMPHFKARFSSWTYIFKQGTICFVSTSSR